MKIALNKGKGIFSLSKEAYRFLGLEWDGTGEAYADYSRRSDPDLIECIEALGAKAKGDPANNVEIAEIPDEADWVISDIGGKEAVEVIA